MQLQQIIVFVKGLSRRNTLYSPLLYLKTKVEYLQFYSCYVNNDSRGPLLAADGKPCVLTRQDALDGAVSGMGTAIFTHLSLWMCKYQTNQVKTA